MNNFKHYFKQKIFENVKNPVQVDDAEDAPLQHVDAPNYFPNNQNGMSAWEIIDPPDGVVEPNDPSLNIPDGFDVKFYTNGTVGYWDLGNGLVIYYVNRGGTWIQTPPGAVPANPFWINPASTIVSNHNPASTTQQYITFPDGTMQLYYQGYWYFLLPNGLIYTIVESQNNYYLFPFIQSNTSEHGYVLNPYGTIGSGDIDGIRPSWEEINNLFGSNSEYIPNGNFRNPYWRPHGAVGSKYPIAPPPSAWYNNWRRNQITPP